MDVAVMPARSRLLVDITPETRLEGDLRLGPGLPLARIALHLLSLHDVTALPVLVRGGRLLALDPAAARSLLRQSATDVAETIVHRLQPAPTLAVHSQPGLAAAAPPPALSGPGLRRRVTGVLRRIARSVVARLPASIREDVRAILIHARQAARTLAYRQPTPGAPLPAIDSSPVPAPNGPPPPRRAARVPPAPLREGALLEVHPRPQDVLWTAGTATPWTALRALSGLRADKCLRIVTLARDLPPLRGDDAALVGATLQAELLLAADLIVTSSATQAAALRDLAARYDWPAPQIDILPAAPQPAEAPTTGWPDELPQARFALVNGTVAPGSGHDRLLAHWEAFVEGNALELNLIILGPMGEGGDGIAEVIEASPLFGRRVFWLEAATESLARRLHADCAALICPGPTDTWPAAAIEALWLGRPVIAARLGGIPPASLGLATLVDPDEPMDWRAAILAAAARHPDGVPSPLPDPIAIEAAMRGFLARSVPA